MRDHDPTPCAGLPEADPMSSMTKRGQRCHSSPRRLLPPFGDTSRREAQGVG